MLSPDIIAEIGSYLHFTDYNNLLLTSNNYYYNEYIKNERCRLKIQNCHNIQSLLLGIICRDDLNFFKILITSSQSIDINYIFKIVFKVKSPKILKFLLLNINIYINKLLLDNANDILMYSIKNNYLNTIKLLTDEIDFLMDKSNLVVQACQYGHIEIVKLLLEKYKIDPSIGKNGPFIVACKYGHIEIVKLFLKDSRINPADYDNLAIVKATENGHIEIVKLLFKRIDHNSQSQNNISIRWACENGYLEIVKMLLLDKNVDPSANNNDAIIDACENGHTEIVKLLLKDSRVNPGDQNNNAVICACKQGYYEIVKLLLGDPRVNPSAQNNLPIINASIIRNYEIVKLLLEDSRVNPSDQNNLAITSSSDDKIINLLLNDNRFIINDDLIKVSLYKLPFLELLLEKYPNYHLSDELIVELYTQYPSMKNILSSLDY